jgi:hypothetical protein
MKGWCLRGLVVVEDRCAGHSDQAADEAVKPKLVIGMRVLLRGATVLPKFRYLKSRYSLLLQRKEADPPQRYVGVEACCISGIALRRENTCLRLLLAESGLQICLVEAAGPLRLGLGLLRHL